MNKRRQFYEAPLAEVFDFSIITTDISLPDTPIGGGDGGNGGAGGDIPIDPF